VWDSGYKGVWHLGSTANPQDSTGVNNAANHGATDAAGEVSGGAALNGSSSYIEAPNTASLQVTGALTVECWAYLNALPTSYTELARKGPQYYLFLNPSGKLGMAISDDYYGAANVTFPAAGQWVHVVGTYDGTTGAVRIYVNGVLQSTRTSTSTLVAGTYALRMGASEMGTQYVNGRLDEMRVSNTARSAAWVATEYSNQSAPGSFYSVGAEETNTGGTAAVTVASSPTGLALTVDGASCTSPCSFGWTAGSTHTIAAATQAGTAGTQYVFASWSDGGAATHTVTAPSTATTYTATFGTQYFLTTAANPAAGGSVTPASGWYDAGSAVPVSAAANSGYQFTGFSGALTGTTSPQTVTLNAPASVIVNAGTQTTAGCAIFPANNVWNTPVDTLPVDANSAAYVQTIGAAAGLHPDFSSTGFGMPFIAAPGTQPPVAVSFIDSAESDPGPYPIPPNAPIEGGANSTGDRHVLALNTGNCKLYEMAAAYPQPDGSWKDTAGAVFDLGSNQLRPDTWTSADAAGLPILAGLVRYDEVVSGAIQHAIRFTAPQTRAAHIWPARHHASSLTGSQYPPMGQRFRLKAAFDISVYPADVQVILAALKRYGMILADNGSSWYLSGAPDSRWNDSSLHHLGTVLGSNLEAVDESSLMADANSAAVTVATASK